MRACSKTNYVSHKIKALQKSKNDFQKSKKNNFLNNLHKSEKFEESNHTELLYCEFINKVLFPNKNN